MFMDFRDFRQYLAMVFMAAIVFTFMWCQNVHAMDIKCYSGGRLIHTGSTNDVHYDNGMMVYLDKETHRYIVPNADCIVFIRPEEVIFDVPKPKSKPKHAHHKHTHQDKHK